MSQLVKRDDLGCQIYKSPQSSQVIEAFQQTVLSWDPNCLTSESAIDIYLQSVDAAAPVHVWKSVTTSSGQLSTTFSPDWWNSTTSVSLQLIITGSDEPAWAGHGPGPVFYGHFNGTVPSDSAAYHQSKGIQTGGPSVELINDFRHRSHGLSSGKLLSAILFPLLALASAIAIYVYISRRRAGQASKRWSQVVDQRMSTIGGHDWEASHGVVLPHPSSLRSVPRSRATSIIAHSASLPPRHSLAASLNPRASAYSNQPRGSVYSSNPNARASVYSHNTNQRGSVYSQSHGSPRIPAPPMAQHSPSRVSFVDMPPPAARGHKTSLSISTSRIPVRTDLLLSPDQVKGPDVLGNSAFPQSISSALAAPQPSLGRKGQHVVAKSTSNLRFELGDDPEVKGALAMMIDEANTKSSATARDPPPRSRSSSALSSNLLSMNTDLSSHDQPWPTTVCGSGGRGSMSSSLGSGNAAGMRRLACRTSVLSPDEALRQYTLSRERSAASPLSSTDSNGMKVMFDATTPVASRTPSSPRHIHQSVYTEASRYSVASGRTSNIPHPHEQSQNVSDPRVL